MKKTLILSSFSLALLLSACASAPIGAPYNYPQAQAQPQTVVVQQPAQSDAVYVQAPAHYSEVAASNTSTQVTQEETSFGLGLSVGNMQVSAGMNRASTNVVGNPSTVVVERPSTVVVERPPTVVVERPPTVVVERPPTVVVERPPTVVVQHGYGSHAVLGMDPSIYQDFLNTLNNAHFDSEKLKLVREVAGNSAISVQQVIGILKVFDFDSEKVKAAAALYSSTIDGRNWFKVYDAFDFDSSKDELRSAVRGQMPLGN